jgi:hypothetical protein
MRRCARPDCRRSTGSSPTYRVNLKKSFPRPCYQAWGNSFSFYKSTLRLASMIAAPCAATRLRGVVSIAPAAFISRFGIGVRAGAGLGCAGAARLRPRTVTPILAG